MTQIHKRFTVDQVRVLLQGYCQGTLDRMAVAEVLGIGKTRFFALLKEYRQDPDKLSLAYPRISPSRLSAVTEEQIRGGVSHGEDFGRQSELADHHLQLFGYQGQP